MLGRRVVLVLLAFGLVGWSGATEAWAHTGLVSADPLPGATLGASPTVIRLSFYERPELSLSAIQVLDARGVPYELGPPEALADDALTIAVPLRTLPRGAYTVTWRVVSALDGHATGGRYAFGVLVSPAETVAELDDGGTGTSGLEIVARWLFLVGLCVIIGAAAASVGRFGAGVPLAAAAWLATAAGLVLLVTAQRRSADASLEELLETSVGRDLIGRAVAVAVAGAGVLLAVRGRRLGRPAMIGAGLAALAGVAVHVAAGHAAAGSWPGAVSVTLQSAHVAAAGVWLGGLAALLLGVGGAPSAAKAIAVRRFSLVAAAGITVVAATGVARSVDELSSWSDLASTGYGRAIVAKSCLLLAIASLGLYNRRHSVPAAATTLRGLRRAGGSELVLAAGAVAGAAVLGTLAPPRTASLATPIGLAASGADVGTSVRVHLDAASTQPGANRFTVSVADYDSGDPVGDARVNLRFVPVDDPDVTPTSLRLAARGDGSYLGYGANLAFAGRWRVVVRVERDSNAVVVPLALEASGPEEPVSIERIPGRAPTYTVEASPLGFVRISPQPERAGTTRLRVTCYDYIGEYARIERVVVTAAAGEDPARQLATRRLARGRFSADLELRTGRNTIAVVARTPEGTRVRAVFELEIDSDPS